MITCMTEERKEGVKKKRVGRLVRDITASGLAQLTSAPAAMDACNFSMSSFFAA